MQIRRTAWFCMGEPIPALEIAEVKILEPTGFLKKTLELFALLLLRRLHVILLQLAVERGLADPQHTRRGKLVSSGFAQRPQNRAPFQFLEGQYLILFRRAF